MKRIRVFCTECTWVGARVSSFGHCPVCDSPVEAQPVDKHRGQRTKWTLSVLNPTRDAFGPREAAEVLDRAAKRRAK